MDKNLTNIKIPVPWQFEAHVDIQRWKGNEACFMSYVDDVLYDEMLE